MEKTVETTRSNKRARVAIGTDDSDQRVRFVHDGQTPEQRPRLARLEYTILGFPPSANAMFGRSSSVKTPFRSNEYDAFIARASADHCVKGRPTAPSGEYSIEMRFHAPNRRWYDLDNRIKPTLDTLVRLGIVDDDRHVVRLVAEKAEPVVGGRVDITIESRGVR